MRGGHDLELVHVTKRYAGGAVAVADVSHLFRAGSYVCLFLPENTGQSVAAAINDALYPALQVEAAE